MLDDVLPVEARDVRQVHRRESLRSSLWFLPLLCLAIGLVAALLASWLDDVVAVRANDLDSWRLEDARSVLTTLAPALLTFLGVVFSITVVALQLASQQYSPRLLRSFVRQPLTKLTLGVFLGTFLFCLLALLSFDSGADGGSEFVPVVSMLLAVLATLACLVVFVAFVHVTVRSMQVDAILRATAEEAHRALDENLPATGAPTPPVPACGPPIDLIRWPLPSGVLHGVQVPALVALAERHATTLRVVVPVGSAVHPGLVVAEVHGGVAPPAGEVAAAFDVGGGRNLYQDVAYGLRQLVDVASKALSPGVNDPTTALQALDHIEGLLVAAASRPPRTGAYRGSDGTVRVVRPVVGFDGLVVLGLTEITTYGASSPQISRRLTALLDVLDAATPAASPVVADQRRLLADEVARQVPDPARRDRALVPDRLGLG